MGFGYLFLGYFFLLRLQPSGIDVTPDIIGCLLMLAGLNKLIVHCPGNKHFPRARIMLIPLAVLSFVDLILQILRKVGELTEELERYLYTPVSYALMLVIGVFTVVLMLGIHKLSLEVELSKLARRAQTSVAVTVGYYIVEILSATGVTRLIANIAAEPDVLYSLINSFLLLLSLVWFFLVWSVIWSSYMRICLEGDEDMPYRENTYDRTLARMKSKKNRRK